MNPRNRRGAALLVALLLSAACSPPITPTPTETPSLTPTPRFSTHVGPVIRATLPPTWTETFTPLPTRTFTPTPVTPTATPTSVPSLAEGCDSLTVDYEFEDGHAFRWNDTITMIYGTPLTAALDPATGNAVPLTVRFLATHRLSGENLGVQLDGGQVFGMELPASQLPRPGYYEWKIAVYGIGEQCVHEGYFFVFRTVRDLTPTTEVTPEATVVQ